MSSKWFDGFFPEYVTAAFSDRRVDFVFPAGDHNLSGEQKTFLRDEWAVDPERCANIRQIHGNRVLRADGPFDVMPDADGIITDRRNLTLLVRTADCLPVFLCDPGREVIGLVHAGWKGSLDRVTAEAVRAMVAHYGTRPADIKAAFGPAISPVFYEVGREFIKYFPKEVTARGLKCSLDIALVNRNQLEDEGVLPGNIMDCGICTYANEQYFSYRREGGAAGRMVSVMTMR
jgi:YfiH family protein